jgi:uncharacterized protein YcbX
VITLLVPRRAAQFFCYTFCVSLTSTFAPRLAQIRVHPIKSLDPVSVTETVIGPSGGLQYDRAWALYTVDGKWVNAKRTAAIHGIRATYASDFSSVTLSVPNDSRQIPKRTFDFPDGHEDAADWFSVFFEQQIIVRYSAGGFPDDPIANGPTIVSTASLQAICDWFPRIALEEARRRFRASLEIDAVPAFWEDQLFSENERNVVRFCIGVVNFEGSNPCARCPVPTRNPYSAENIDGFQKRFNQLREETLPAWSPRDRFDHFYRLSTNTRIASPELGKPLVLGDSLTVL